MSQAPVKAESYKGNLAYVEGFKSIHDQIDSGVSWSGHERNSAFLNLGQTRSGDNTPLFADVSAATGFDFPDDSRALATLDWDHDGDMDLVITNRTGPRLRILRNTTDGRGQFVMLQLQGVQGNRDAIGARAVITLQRNDETATLMRTVYAGHGFISQGSKTLHFGIDAGASIRQVDILWPGGTRASITGVQPNGTYRIVEGHGAAKRLSDKPIQMAMTAGKPVGPVETDAASIRLEDPIPLPSLRYRQGEGDSAKAFVLSPPYRRPILVNLWATWCLPCLAELKELAEHKKELDAAGVDVMALNLDEIQPGATKPKLTPKQFLERMAFPYVSGTVTPRLMQVIEAAHNSVFLRPHDLPIPFSILLDRKGRIAAVYRGPVTVSQLTIDVQALQQDDGGDWAAHSRHFAGRWLEPRRKTPFLLIASKLLEQDLVLEASELLMGHADDFKGEADYPSMLMVCGTRNLKAKQFQMAGSLLQRAVELEPTLAEAHNNLATVYRSYSNRPLAIQHLAQALTLKPDYVEARLNYASVLAETGKYAEALKQVDMVLTKNDKHAVAVNFAGQLNLQLKQWPRARELFARMIEIDPNHVDALVNLGGTCHVMGQIDDAIVYYERAMKLNPKLGAVRQTLDRLYDQRKSGKVP